MELRHLIMIKEVARFGNLTRAAEQLYLSQSALSHQLKEIETYFGTQVFIRQNKQMILTHNGKLILETGEKVLRQIEETKRTIYNLNNKDAGEIRLSTECYTSYHWLSGFLSDFKRIYPEVEVIINPDATYQSVKHLLDNNIDIAILEDNDHPKLNYTELFKDEFLAVVPHNHGWADLKWVESAHFYDVDYIMYNIPNERSTIYKQLFREKGPKRVYKITLTEAILEMVKANLGVAVLPNWIIRPYIEDGRLVPVQVTRKGIKRTWYAATLKNKELPPYMNTFIKTLAKHLKKSEELSSLMIKTA